MNVSCLQLDYIAASCMYGTLPLAQILPEVRRSGAEYIDIWPRSHGDQREQIEQMGAAAFAELLAANGVKLGMVTRFDLGPFGLQAEMAFAKRLGARILVCGSKGPKDLQGEALRAAVAVFAEALKPHIAAAAEAGLTIAIENHSNALIESPDSMKWLVEMTASPHLGIALAPYHLPDDAQLVAQLIEDLAGGLAHFYAWQHGMGCHEPLPKEQELLQLPGRGELDFSLLLAALARSGYQGWTEVFMHPVPRGIPILPTAAAVTDEVLRAQNYLAACAATNDRKI